MSEPSRRLAHGVSRTGAALLLLAASCSKSGSDAPPKAVEPQVDEMISSADLEAGRQAYLLHCSSCHGKNLEGGLGTALIKSNWMYGRDSFSISLNIQNGIPSAGMPAFGDILSEEESENILNYILDVQTAPLGRAAPIPDQLKTTDYTLRVERLVENELNEPWGIEFVDERRALITENTGQLFWMIDGVLDPTPIAGLPTVDQATSTGGLLDIALDPNYTENGWIYLAYSHSADPNDVNAAGMTHIMRARVENHQLIDVQRLFEAPVEYHRPNSKHWGGRLMFGADGYLYFSIGDMSQPDDAQDPARPTGKIHRIESDGGLPEDNPFAGDDQMASMVYSLGNRNVQGIAQHPETGDIWSTEHGPHGGDELNIIKKGANYGWPVTTYGLNYDGSIISDLTEKEGIETPVTQWTPALAVSAIDFVTGDKFGSWQNDLLVASLSREELRRLRLEGSTVVEEEILFKGYGRIRDVKIGPDGALYVLFNGPGLVARLSPTESVE